MRKIGRRIRAVLLAFTCVATHAAAGNPAEEQQEGAQARVEISHLSGPGGTRSSSEELLRLETRKEFLFEIRYRGEGHDGENRWDEYTVFIRAATFEEHSDDGTLVRGWNGAEGQEWKSINDLMAKGEIKASVAINERGFYELPTFAGLSEREHQARSSVLGMESLLWPPLPKPGEPFEAGAEWAVNPNELGNSWRGPWFPVVCQSLGVWTDGRSRIVLKSDGDPTGGRKGPMGGEMRVQYEWVLDGRVPAVVEATEREWDFRQDETPLLKRSLQMVSGSVPVRPERSR